MSAHPQRIVCLSAEAADWLWRLGAWDLVAGTTAYFQLPPGAPPKPRLSGFSSASMQSILTLAPDLIITFSDIQAGIASQLILNGCTILATNQRTLAEVEATLAMIARVVGCEAVGESLLGEFRERLAPVPEPIYRPRVYFEEWNEPLITGIAWVSELIERAGGEDAFASLRRQGRAPNRVVAPEQIIAAAPEFILASWCGNPVSIEAIRGRPGWSQLPAIRQHRVYEIPGADILQPGCGLIRGYERIVNLLRSPSKGNSQGSCFTFVPQP